MKTKITLLLLLIGLTSIAQQSYYDDVDITLEGQSLYNELQDKVSSGLNANYTYGDFRDTLKITDANPDDSSEVLLIYGFNDNDGDCTTDLTRDNDNFGGNACEYNREHTFPRSLSDPPMGSASNGSNGIVADPHNLRPSDVQRNGNRGSKKFADGSGNSGDVGSGNWYPGDAWKGDAARIVMFMYLRYGERCLPEFVGVGATQGSTEMLQLFLEWNAEDPVSEVEMQRNPQLETEYGSRNPFIDNPALATRIWGGVQAEDLWGTFSVTDENAISFSLYPNPARHLTTISSATPFKNITVFDITGKKVYESTFAKAQLNNSIPVRNLAKGMYLVQVEKTVQKLIVR
ncbi:T9SS C-terminal target domain-containing protein [Dokdonia sinensis]|uniref:T9SS C-terminal target domain-containing protein n=1 Tax=Dokdonia sinensis TaxID=2479847 RepID=A0A3M0G9Z9_9FLAO|nr:endonuclease [Dokdonia sinensis]RMB61087.1 T9SS C-terminal target domain-containing protein [Dokdonia sinensis]